MMNSYDQYAQAFALEICDAKKFLSRYIKVHGEMHWWIASNRQLAAVRYEDLVREFGGAIQAHNPLLLRMILWDGSVIQCFGIDTIERHRGELPYSVVCERVKILPQQFDIFFVPLLTSGREIHIKFIHSLVNDHLLSSNVGEYISEER